MLKRLWRITVLVVATLCFLLALFLNYDGLGQALGLSAYLTGKAGRIVLASMAALAVALVMARFNREPAPATASKKKKPGTARKTPAKKTKSAPKTARRKPAADRAAASRPAPRRR